MCKNFRYFYNKLHLTSPSNLLYNQQCKDSEYPTIEVRGQGTLRYWNGGFSRKNRRGRGLTPKGRCRARDVSSGIAMQVSMLSCHVWYGALLVMFLTTALFFVFLSTGNGENGRNHTKSIFKEENYYGKDHFSAASAYERQGCSLGRQPGGRRPHGAPVW